MNTQDILNIFLILGFVIITCCVVFTTFFMVQALKSIIRLADNLDETTQGIKEKVQMKALAAIPALLVALVSKVVRKKRG